jgi:protoporphyrinogen oxidase
MSLEWVERVPNPPISDIIKSSIGIETEGYTHQSRFFYPRIGGIQALINHLERWTKDNLVADFDAKYLRKEDGVWIVSNGKEERTYDKVVSTIPIQDLIKALDAPKRVTTAASNLLYNSLISIMIGIDKSKLNDLSWLYIPDKHVLPHRVSFPSNFSQKTAPKGKSSALAEVTTTFGSRIWRMKDEDITKRVVDELHSLRLLNKDDVCFKRIKRSKYAYVITDLNYSENIKIVKSYTNDVGIDLLGRFAEFKYLNMDDCIGNAIDYVKNHFGKVRNFGA